MFTLKFFKKDNGQGNPVQETFAASLYRVTHLDDRIDIYWENPTNNSSTIFSLGDGPDGFNKLIVENMSGKTTDIFHAYKDH